MATVEAMAAGLPVIASSVGGLADSVVDGVTGRLVPPDDPHRLAGALGSLIEDADRARQMGLQGQRRAHETYDYHVACAKLDAMLKEVSR